MPIPSHLRLCPWPQISAESVLFLAFAATAVEERLLQEWVETHRVKGSDWRQVVVDSTTEPTWVAEIFKASSDFLVVPIRIVWLPHRKTPSWWGGLFRSDPRHPGAFRASRILKQSPERVQAIFGKPAMVSELGQRFGQRMSVEAWAEPEKFAAFVEMEARVALDISERRLLGGRYRLPSQVTDQLSHDPLLHREVECLAQQQGRSVKELWQSAQGYMKEMIAVPTAFGLDLNSRFNNLVLGFGYEKRLVSRKEDLARIAQILNANPCILLWTHKTYLDGMVLPKLLYDNNLPVPHSFGGANMSFAGLGYLMRSGGGIFIRRSFQDNPLYKTVLRFYIALLMKLRFPLSWSFEGTRSRLGKLMPPRYGLLKYVLEACHSSGAKNIHIVPVAISYDLIRDVEEYASEQVGRVKQAESLSWFLGYLSSLRKPMGRLYVDFGEAIVLEDAPDPDNRLALQKIAFQVAVEANRVTPLTAPSLLTMSLLGAAPQALTEDELRREVRALWEWASERQIRISDDFNPRHLEHFQSLLEIMINENVIRRYDEGPDVVYGIPLQQHPAASYYRNTTIHFFVNKAIIELALMKVADSGDEDPVAAFWIETENLRDLFKFEFFYPPSEEFRVQLEHELQRSNPCWEQILLEGGAALQTLIRDLRPLVAHATLLTYVEAYQVVADMLARLRPDETIEQKNCVERALKYGRQAYLQRRISSEASIGKILFANAYKLMAHRNLHEPGDPELQIRRREMAQNLRLLARRLERIRLLVADERTAHSLR